MPRLPRITGRRARRALERAGWYVERQQGSHLIMRHPDKPEARVTLPVHSREILLPKTLGTVLDQAGMTVERLRELL